jgi:pimeloyl-ACP methyl ester carboxylesterase
MYGYCTLAFDRLGIADSSHGEPLSEIQAPLEVAATAALTMMLRNGSFPGVNFTFTKVVHVGHSFGSAQTYSLANMYPNITDGIILTGFSMNSTFAGYFLAAGNLQQASTNQPLRFSNISGAQVQNLLSQYASGLVDYLSPISFSGLPKPQNLPNGYLVSSDQQANKYQFFHPNYYNPAILPYTEGTKQPVTLGEILTLGSLPMKNNYAGPVMVINGSMHALPTPTSPTFSIQY